MKPRPTHVPFKFTILTLNIKPRDTDAIEQKLSTLSDELFPNAFCGTELNGVLKAPTLSFSNGNLGHPRVNFRFLQELIFFDEYRSGGGI